MIAHLEHAPHDQNASALRYKINMYVAARDPFVAGKSLITMINLLV